MKYLPLFAILATFGVFNTMGAPAAAGQKGGAAVPKTPTTPTPKAPAVKPPPATPAGAPAPSVTVTINGNNLVYPALDVTPDTSDPIVQGWLKSLDLSNVPKLPQSNGGKINYAQAQCAAPTVIQPDQGSWTCQKVVSNDDVDHCPEKGVWGLTYDDGPSVSTPNLLAVLNKNNVKATFFVVGSRVISNPQTLKAAYDAGHNIAVHTWSHPALTSLPTESIAAELMWTLKAIKDVIGVTPIFMRPPYGDTDNRVRAITRAVGLWTVLWTEGFDTDDWSLLSGTKESHVLDIFNGWVNKVPTMDSGFIVLEHDLYPQTVNAAISVMNIAVKEPSLTIKTVPQCIGVNETYLETGGKRPSLKGDITIHAMGSNTGTTPAGSNAGTNSASSPNSSPSTGADGSVKAQSTDGGKSSGSIVIYSSLPIIAAAISAIFVMF